jgi:hypothetical protein
MKVTINENWRVVVEPRGLGSFGFGSISDYAIEPDKEKREAKYKDACGDIIQEIKRHVDGVGSAYWECDTRHECSFCGYEWDVDEIGCPLCCQDAIDEFNEANHETNDVQ